MELSRRRVSDSSLRYQAQAYSGQRYNETVNFHDIHPYRVTSHTKDNNFEVEVNSLLPLHVCKIKIGNFFPVGIFNGRSEKDCLIGGFIAIGHSVGALDRSGFIKSHVLY